MKILLNNTKAIFIFLLLLTSSSIIAQTLAEHKFYGKYTKVYKLDSTQARMLYQLRTVTDTIDYFSNLDSVYETDSAFKISGLQKGHYLVASAKGHQVNYKSHENQYFKIKTYGYNREAWVIISDYNGKILEDAVVHIRGKEYLFREDCGCHPVPGVKGNGWTKVTFKNEFTYLNLNGYKAPRNGYRNKKTKFKNANKLFSDVRILPGYTAFNQPKYHLGDTVKMKAFLVSEKGKPWKRKTKVVILDPRKKQKNKVGQEVHVSKVLKPVTDGAYVYNFAVPDTFSIDTDYYVEFQTKKGQILKRNNFRVEDYELGKTTYTANLTKREYYRGDAVRLKMTAKDVNGLPLLDAHAKVVVKMESLIYHHLDTFFLDYETQKSVFNLEMMLDVSGETFLELPDSLFPLIDANYRVIVKMNNSENESKEFSRSFRFKSQTEQFKIKLVGDTIKASYQYLSEFDSSCAVTFKSYSIAGLLEEKQVQLPYQEKLDYTANKYEIIDDQGNLLGQTTTPSRINKLIYPEGKRTHNHIEIKLVNELGIPVSYQLFKGRKKFKGGRGTTMSFEEDNESLDSYYIMYSFRWQGKDYVKEEGYHIKEKTLVVDVDQPEKVLPGATVPITVKVTDYKTNGAANVNITAWSVNMKFNNIPTPDLPDFGLQHFDIVKPFNVYYSNQSANVNHGITHENIKRLDLMETPMYRFIYGKGGLDVEYDSINSSMAEITPYLFKDQALRSIHTIYLDDEPLYINNGQSPTDFSFRKKPGKYKLTLRSKDHIYTVKEVELKAHQKAFVCLHIDSAYANENVSYVKLDTMPFMKVEQERLKTSFLVANTYNHNLFFEQDSLVFKSGYNRNVCYDQDYGRFGTYGPFKKGTVNVIDVQADTAYSFYFEPGYLYTFHKDTSWVSQPILYPNPLEAKNAYETSVQWNFHHLAKMPPIVGKERRDRMKKKKKLVYKSIKEAPARMHPMLKARRHVGDYRKDKCIVQFQNNTGQTRIRWSGIFSFQNDSLSSINFGTYKQLQNVKAEVYHVVAFMEDSSLMVIPDFTIHPNGINYFRFDQANLMAYDSVNTKKYEDIIIELNKPKLREFRNPPRVIDGIKIFRDVNEQKSTMISGYFMSHKGEPMNNVNIYAEIAGIFKAGAVTNEAGYFEMDSVPSGNYMLKMIMADRMPYSVYDIKIQNGKDNQLMIEPEILFFGIGLPSNGMANQFNDIFGSGGSSNSYAAESPISNMTTLSANDISLEGTAFFTSARKESKKDKKGEELAEAAVIRYNVPLIDKDGGETGGTISSDDISRIPATGGEADIASYIGVTPGVVYNWDFKDGSMNDPEGTKNIDKEKGKFKQLEDLKTISDKNSNRIRTTFRDYGFWMPNMVTGKDGIARFEVKFPDNITKWKTIVPAMDGNKQTGIGYAETQSYKPLSASLGIPNFLIVGDTVDLVGKLSNYTKDPISVKTYFDINGKRVLDGTQSPKHFSIENYALSSSQVSKLDIVYGLDKGDGYIDGEQRELNVMVKGVKRSTGKLYDLVNDTSFTLGSSDNITSRSLYITNDPFDLIRKELKDLKNYSYGCNEQTASKLKALVLEKKFMINLKEAFRDESLLIKCIRTLEKNQNKDGSWGWWGSGKTDIWITGYVTEALNLAVASGYRTAGHMKGAGYLRKQLDRLNNTQKLEVLNILAAIPFPMDYSLYFKKFNESNLSLQDQFQYIKLRQKRDSSIVLDEILNSFDEGSKGIFWGESVLDIKVNKMQTSLLAYEILKKVGGHDDLLKRTRSYFLNYKVKEKNTIEQANMLQHFLADMLKESTLQKAIEGKVTINGTVLSPTYPKEMEFTANETIKIEKSGAPVQIYAYEHTIETNPVCSDTLFQVSTKFLIDGKEVKSLTAGEPVTLEVEVIAKRGAKYVLIEIPIPAGCSYGGKVPTKHRNENYREAFKYRTSIACDQLPAGRNKFYVQLVPRFTGTFSMLPSSAQLMYFPNVSNYTNTKAVVIVPEEKK